MAGNRKAAEADKELKETAHKPVPPLGAVTANAPSVQQALNASSPARKLQASHGALPIPTEQELKAPKGMVRVRFRRQFFSSRGVLHEPSSEGELLAEDLIKDLPKSAEVYQGDEWISVKELKNAEKDEG